MIYVTNGNQSEPLVYLSSFEWEQEVKGDFSISFNSVNDSKNVGHSILLEESIITVDDFDFRVKQMKETRHGKQVTALSTYFDLVDKRQNEIYGGTHTFEEFATFVLKDTGWTFTFDQDVSESRMIANFGENNVVALVNALCQVYTCEFEIKRNNHIHFARKIGGDYDAQYRYGHNVQALSKDVDTTKLKTYIEGFGYIDEENGGQIWVSYESPNAAKFGKREADPVHDDRFTKGEELLEHLKTVLEDEPEVTFELDSIELIDKELGERVWLIYEPLGIELQTRILSQTKGFVNGELRTVKVVLGNAIPKSTTDILISQKVEIDENKKITRSRFEQTNDRITLAVERIGEVSSELTITADEINARVDKTNESVAEINIKADEINLQVNNKIDNAVTTINQRADRIELKAQQTDNNVASLTIQSGQIQSTVSSQGQQIGNMQTQITQTDQKIEFRTQGDQLVSSINMSPYGVTINADKINLNGAVIANGSITGYSSLNIATDATVGNNLYLGQGNGSKSLVFNNSNRINASGYGMDLNAQQITLSSSDITIGTSSYSRTGFNGTVDFFYANVLGVARAESSGIGISYSGGYLYVKVNGSTMGSVKLT